MRGLRLFAGKLQWAALEDEHVVATLLHLRFALEEVGVVHAARLGLHQIRAERGLGGGGAGRGANSNSSNATDTQGGGGGGGTYYGPDRRGGDGGNGIVLIRYPL